MNKKIVLAACKAINNTCDLMLKNWECLASKSGKDVYLESILNLKSYVREIEMEVLDNEGLH